MRIEQLMSKLFGFSTQTYFNWKKDSMSKRPIITLLEKYFSKEELEEFLETGKISKLEQSSDAHDEFEVLRSKVIENSLYEAKRKYKIIFGSFGLEFLNNYGSKEILKEILPNVTNYTIETAKDKLFEHIKGYETKKFGIPKNTGKKELLSKYIQRSFTTTEIYAMLENQETFFDLDYIY